MTKKLVQQQKPQKPINSENEDREFIEGIFFSPLGRADTHMDVIIRRIGVYIQSAYAEKSFTDLILGALILLRCCDINIF